MNKSNRCRISATILCLFLGSIFACSGPNGSSPEKFCYAAEMSETLCGYTEIGVSQAEENGRSVVLIKESGQALLSALGAEINTRSEAEYRLNPENWQLISCKTEVDQGSLKLHISASVEGETIRIMLQPGGGEKKVTLPPGVIFENPVYFPHLLKDFGENGLATKRYRIIDLFDREIQDVTYTKERTEAIQLGGKMYNAIVLDYLNHEIGFRLRLWINAQNGYMLKTEGPRSVSSLADRSIKSKLQRADLDNYIFAKAGASVSDIPAISYMKVRAKLEPIGNWITPDSLRVPGQSFDGTVENNRIEGVFEVRHEKYDGRNAPPFPPNFGGDPELRSFLAPEDFIESDDPVLIHKAKELTAGAKDSWEAAKRLSQWVAENIGYDIPGGASARNTYDIKEGECGAHSRLFVAFCRGVGIPARVVWGCMYVPNLGGSFGQHAWNEVYMGQIGWIPLDTTAREIDFADSGHIRLGILSSAHVALNPEQMQILDFQAGPQRFGGFQGTVDAKKYQPYLGRYKGPRGIITVSLEEGGLVLTLADKRVFGLREPDEKGEWLFKLSRDVGVTFDRDSFDAVGGLTILNRVRLPKKAEPQDISDAIPENLRPYLGQYSIPMSKADLVVSFRNGTLAVQIPGRNIQDVDGPDAAGVWRSKSGPDRFSFIMDDSGRVRTMILIETVRCTRID